MKRLFVIVALSMAVVACNKEEDNDQLAGWDKIIAGVEPVEMSVLDVLHSLNEDEVWQCRSACDYILNEATGEVEEHIYLEDFFSHLYGASMPTLRYVNNEEIRFYKPYPFTSETGPRGEVLSVSMEDDDTIKLETGDYISRYNIIAYDKNQIIFEEYIEENEGTKWLYKRMWYVRYVDDTKWWKNAVPDGQE